jgi:hypothetical protein
MKSNQTITIINLKGVIMETIHYTPAILWYASWPVVIYISYKFVLLNIEHLEENIEPKEKKKELK